MKVRGDGLVFKMEGRQIRESGPPAESTTGLLDFYIGVHLKQLLGGMPLIPISADVKFRKHC